MKTEEAIEFKQLVQFCVMELGEYPSNYYDKYFNQIINALKHGEKYEKMWEEFKKEYRDSSVSTDQKTNLINPIYLYDLMNIFEEKYFTKKEVIK